MHPFSTTTVHFGFLVTNLEDEFVVLDPNATVIHRTNSLADAMSFAKKQRELLDANETLRKHDQ